MKIIYSPLHTKHNPKWEVINEVKDPYAEVPERIESIVSTLKKNGYEQAILPPQKFPLKHIEAVHQKHYINHLKNISEKEAGKFGRDGYFSSFFIMDRCAPVVSGTYEAAIDSVNVALTGAKMLQKEKRVYALSRPPGHHAEKNIMGGYCYFNNAAVAAEYLSHEGKVAILDIDFHHGNGTQRIFYERADVYYVSLHGNPAEAFPYIAGFADEQGSGVGKGFNKNFPLPLGTNDANYEKALKQAIALIKKFQPKNLIVSCGFDTYEKDPIGHFKLTIPFYEKMAGFIGALDLPTLVIQEGGYNVDDLGAMALSLLKGFQEKK